MHGVCTLFIFFVKDWDIDWYLGLDDYASDCSAEETLSEASFISSALTDSVRPQHSKSVSY